jgi:hypothetical protein
VGLSALLLLGGCSGAPAGTTAGASGVPVQTGGTGSGGPADTGGPGASGPAATPDPAFLAELAGAGLAPEDLALLAATTFEGTTSGPGSATIVEHLGSGDTVTFTVTIAAASGGTPGLVSSSSATTEDRIDVHLEYLISADGMSDEVRASLDGVASARNTTPILVAGPLVAAEPSIYQATLDWAINKAKGTVRDTAIKNILKGALPGKAPGAIMGILKGGLTIERGAEIASKLNDQLAAIDRIEECAKDPTNPLTIKEFAENPAARDRILDHIAQARRELIANTLVMELGVANGYAAGFGPKWLGYAIGPGTAWSRAILEKLNQRELDTIRNEAPKCECPLVTEGVTPPMTWRAEHRANPDNEWLVRGKTSSGGLDETWMYRAIIDPATNEGTYKYESIGSLASGTYTKNGTADATLTIQPDGSAITTFRAADVRGVITAGGTTQTVTMKVPAAVFTWKPIGTRC